MHINNLIDTFSFLGVFVTEFLNSDEKKKKDNFAELHFAVNGSYNQNRWFTQDFVYSALKNIGLWLKRETLYNWCLQNGVSTNFQPKKVGIIMAGNLPLVGFHDFLSVIISGNMAIVKLSSKDSILLPTLALCMTKFNPQISTCFSFVSEIPEDIDAVIATGTDSTISYLKKKYEHQKNIFRGSCYSVAVLTGEETCEQLKALADDVFLYFGLGCRSVSKIYVNKDFNIIEKLKPAFSDYEYLLEHKEWRSNLTFRKAILSAHNQPFFDLVFIVAIKSEQLSSQLATLHIEEYEELDNVKKTLFEHKELIQCVVGDSSIFNNCMDFGKSQSPDINCFANNINTLAFLKNIS